jgi:IPT/TIG domain-containing protein
MKAGLIVVLLISAATLAAFQALPKCSAVDPDTAKTGDTVSITCENADKANVSDLYLTDGTDDTKVVVMDHTADKIKFQVPKIKAGRYHIAFLNANKSSMIEQPVVLTVE